MQIQTKRTTPEVASIAIMKLKSGFVFVGVWNIDDSNKLYV